VKDQSVTNRTKLLISHFVAMLIIAGSAGAYFYVNISSSLMSPIQNRLQYSVGVISQAIDADTLAGIEGPFDTSKAEYKLALLKLRDFSRLNKDIAFLYIMRKAGDEIQFVVNSDETKEQSMPGSVYGNASSNLHKGFTTAAVEDKIFRDEGGTFLSGYAPLMNGAGRYLLGIDMKADEVGRKFRLLRISGAVFLIASIVIAFLFSRRLFPRFTYPLGVRISCRRAIAVDRLEYRLDSGTNDTLDDLADAFNTVSGQLSASERKQKEAIGALRNSRDEMEVRCANSKVA
jgi:methyl-accepting chemotaxis protein